MPSLSGTEKEGPGEKARKEASCTCTSIVIIGRYKYSAFLLRKGNILHLTKVLFVFYVYNEQCILIQVINQC